MREEIRLTCQHCNIKFYRDHIKIKRSHCIKCGGDSLSWICPRCKYTNAYYLGGYAGPFLYLDEGEPLNKLDWEDEWASGSQSWGTDPE